MQTRSLSLPLSRSGRNVLFDATSQCAIGDTQIVARLKIDPELRRRAEVSPEANRGVDRDRTAGEDDVIGTCTGYLDGIGQLLHAVHRLQELVAKDFAWMDGR